MEIRHVMSTPVVTVPPDVSLEVAARRMAEAGVRALPVVVNDRVTGMITDRDLVVRAIATGLAAQEEWVRTVMSINPITMEADSPVLEAMYAMRSIDARHIPVTEHGRLVGMVSFDDLFCYLVMQLGELARVVNAAGQRLEAGTVPSNPPDRD